MARSTTPSTPGTGDYLQLKVYANTGQPGAQVAEFGVYPDA